MNKYSVFCKYSRILYPDTEYQLAATSRGRSSLADEPKGGDAATSAGYARLERALAAKSAADDALAKVVAEQLTAAGAQLFVRGNSL